MATLTQLIEHYCSDGVEYVKLGDVAEIITGKTPKTSKSELWGGSTPFVTPTDFANGYDSHGRTARYVSDQALQVAKNKIIGPGATLVTCIASIGGVAFVTEQCLTNQQINAVIPSEKLTPRFVYYAMQESADYLRSLGGSGTMPIVNKAKFSEVIIPLPPCEVQDAIVERLDAFAALIESLDSEITLREKRFEYFREQLLTFNESDGVEYVKLGEVAEIITGKTPKTSEPALWGGSTPFVTPTDFANGYDSHGRTARYVSDQALQAAKTKVVGSGATLVTCIASIGGVAFVTEQCLTNQQINAVIPSEKLIPRFVYYVMQESADYLRSLGGSGTMPIVNKAKFSGIPIPLPPREVQQDIADKLDTMQALIDNLKQERELRQSQFEYYREKLLTFNS